MKNHNSHISLCIGLLTTAALLTGCTTSLGQPKTLKDA